MSKPEIARRCHVCGASIRDLAVFCPQCGESLKTTGELARPDRDKSKSAARFTAPLNEAPKQEGQLNNGRSPDKLSGKPKQSAANAQASPQQSLSESTSKNPADRTKGTPGGTPGAHVPAGARGRVQRATGLARNVGDDVIQRGQKLREMSGVVLDEASYDPSLRFVLVAAALFLLFLVIVLLNRFIV